MTEFWVSQAKYFCKHCKVWMSDNKHVRQLHEGGSNHKFNVRQALKNAHKKVIEEDMAKKELLNDLKEIEKSALEAFAKDAAEGDISNYGIKPRAKPAAKAQSGMTEAYMNALELVGNVRPVSGKASDDTKGEKSSVSGSTKDEKEDTEVIPPPPPQRDDEAPEIGKWVTVDPSESEAAQETYYHEDEENEEDADQFNYGPGESVYSGSSASEAKKQKTKPFGVPFETRVDPNDEKIELGELDDEPVGFKKRKASEKKSIRKKTFD